MKKKDDTKPQEEKFKEMFDMTLESDHDYYGPLDETINYFGLICKAAQGDYMRKIFNNDIVMFNTQYEDEDAVLIVVQIPMNVNEDDETTKPTKFVANRVMKMIFLAERCLIKLDVCETDKKSEEKFVYIKMVKKVGG
jgi:hypothetical protein